MLVGMSGFIVLFLLLMGTQRSGLAPIELLKATPHIMLFCITIFGISAGARLIEDERSLVGVYVAYGVDLRSVVGAKLIVVTIVLFVWAALLYSLFILALGQSIGWSDYLALFLFVLTLCGTVLVVQPIAYASTFGGALVTLLVVPFLAPSWLAAGELLTLRLVDGFSVLGSPWLTVIGLTALFSAWFAILLAPLTWKE